MKSLTRIVISAALLALPLSALAHDDDDDDDRHKRHHHYNKHHYKHHHKYHKHQDRGHRSHGYVKTYWDGNCKVSVRQFQNGGYQEKRHCLPQQQATQRPVYGPVQNPAPVVIHPGISIPGIFPFPY